jgi:hypothetical protein
MELNRYSFPRGIDLCEMPPKGSTACNGPQMSATHFSPRPCKERGRTPMDPPPPSPPASTCTIHALLATRQALAKHALLIPGAWPPSQTRQRLMPLRCPRVLSRRSASRCCSHSGANRHCAAMRCRLRTRRCDDTRGSSAPPEPPRSGHFRTGDRRRQPFDPQPCSGGLWRRPCAIAPLAGVPCRPPSSTRRCSI